MAGGIRSSTVLNSAEALDTAPYITLCHQIPEALGIVISQDGNVRFIKRRNGLVTYWEQAISFALKIS